MRFTLALMAGLVGLTLNCAHAGDYKVGALQISTPWSRATPKGADVGVGYMKITNTGTTPDRLVGGSTTVSSKFEVHDMVMENNVMKMRPVQGGLEIKPGATVELKPGSLHAMFMGLKKPLAAGDHVTATLEFEKAGKVEVQYEVRAMGAPPPGGGMQHGH